MRAVALLILLAMLVPVPAMSWETYVGRTITGKVVEVSDGNVFTLMDKKGKNIPIRLYGIGIPTLKQPFGKEAHQQMQTILSPGISPTITIVNEGEEGIYSALVQVADRSLNNRLVSEGLAWVDRHTCKAFFCRRWHIEEHIAQKERRGVWSVNVSTPPWQWGEPRKN